MRWCPVASILEKIFPILTWSKNYNADKAVSDLLSGITVGMTLIPQSMAYASLAELGPQYGLYSSICGGFVYVLFGTIPELHIAPTALLSLVTYSHTLHVTFGKQNAVVLLCFVAGVIELLCGILHLGFLVDFVSAPVVAAFTSAVAITVASSQVKNLLGLQFIAETFMGAWYKIFEHIGQIKKWDAILGLSCFIMLLFLKKIKDYGEPPFAENCGNINGKRSKIKGLLWFISISRNVVVVGGCSLLAFFLEKSGNNVLTLTNNVPSGLPNITLPPIEVNYEGMNFSFVEMVSQLGISVFVVPFIAVLGNVAIAKAFAKGKAMDASQEMIALGMCNIVGSCFGSYPINASFTRGAISNATGVKTPTAGIYTGILVILSLTFLTPFFSYIPKPTLAAVVICAVLSMVEVTMTKLIWKINKIDLLPFTITLLSCLLIGLEIGIIIGVCVDIILLLHSSARPKILFEVVMDNDVGNYIKITPTSAITFPSAEYIRERIMNYHRNESSTEQYMVVIDCHRIHKMDFTAGKCLGAMMTDLKNNNRKVIFLEPRLKIVKVLKNVCANDILVAETEEELRMHLKHTKEMKLPHQEARVESFKQVREI
ncbi:hypothetical protein HHI36_013916 [Cryptolaemus montrouzieri]|uniref:STAS domain-containing protein n=1 Tax=Cryptolaemus montrouzieri TaxID=559131 RepID=A0ABD2N1R4_9CUCU